MDLSSPIIELDTILGEDDKAPSGQHFNSQHNVAAPLPEKMKAMVAHAIDLGKSADLHTLENHGAKGGKNHEASAAFYDCAQKCKRLGFLNVAKFCLMKSQHYRRCATEH